MFFENFFEKYAKKTLTNGAGYKIVKAKYINNVLNSRVIVFPIISCPHPIINRKQNGKYDFVGNRFPQ